MKFNGYLLSEEIRDILLSERLRSEPDKAELSRVRICTYTPKELERDTLYITTPQVLEKIQGRERGHSFIVPGKIRISGFQGDLLLVRGDISLIELYNRIEEILFRYSQWEASLRDVIVNHLPAKELFVRSADIIRNAMLAANEEFGFLFFYNPTHNNVYKESPVVSPDVEKVTLGNTGMKDLLGDPDFVKRLNSRKPIYYPGSSRRRKKLIQNIYLNSSLVARVIIDGVDADIKKKDVLLIKVLAEYLGRSIAENEVALTNQSKDIEDLLLTFLNQTYENRNRYLRILSRYHWSDEDTYLCVSLSSDKIPNRDNVLNIFSLNLCHNIHEAYFVQNDDISITIVINLSRSKRSVAEIAAICEQTGATLNMYYGISRPCRGIYSLHYAWRQSLFANRTAYRKKERLLYFDNCQLEYYLSEFFHENTPDMALPDALRRLQKYDEENNTQLVHCLRVYLENQGNVSASARELYVHRNTMLYQIERIREIGMTDLDSYEERLALEIALKALEYSRR